MLLLFATFSISAQINPCNFSAGVLSNPDGMRVNTVCLDDGDPPVDVVRTGFVGGESQYFITTTGGRILSVPVGGPPFDLSEFGTGFLAIYHVAYSGELFNVGIDDNVCMAGATECFNLSNAIVVVRNAGEDCEVECTAMAGQITLADGSGESTTICIDEGSDSAVDVTLSGDIDGETTTFIITDNTGQILGIPGGNGPFDLSGAGTGTCLIWHLAYGDDFTGLAVGLNADGFEGCFNLSNPITVNRLQGNDCFDPVTFNIDLNGVNQVPVPVTSLATGSVTATLRGTELVVEGSFSGLSSDYDFNAAGGAHLHLGFAGQAGPVSVILNTKVDDDLRGGTFEAAENTFTLNEEQIAAMQARGIYLNIHSVDNPAGEIRGQALPEADTYSRAYLFGVNEVPSIITTAYGGVAIERNGNEIVVTGSFTGLSGPIATQLAGGAHIHMGVVGRNGPVLIPLNLDMSDDMTSAIFRAEDNTYDLTDALVELMEENGLYVNVHSSEFLSGELRGQITDNSTTSFYADLSGHQERPAPVNTDGNGRVQINLTGNEITVFGSVADLSDEVLVSLAGGAHLHLGLAGQSGGIEFPLNIDLDDAGNAGVWSAANNTFTVTDEQVQSILDRRYYVNVHTPAVMSGEVRGQVMNLAKGYLGSNLNGLNARPAAILTTGNGFVMYELQDRTFNVTGSFQDLSSDFDANIAGGSHIHRGDASRSGPIFFELNAQTSADLRSGVYEASENSFAMNTNQRARLINGNNYLNLHTTGNPSGEIRGQILRDDNAFPEAVVIESPADGDSIVVSSGNSNLVGGTFSSAEDPNGDLVVYSVEFTTVEGALIPVTVLYTIGRDTTVARTFDAVYDTLIARGAFDGLQFDLRYRIFAGDGSVNTPDEYRTINLLLDGSANCSENGGTLALEDGGDALTICAGDGIEDPFNVVVSDTSATNFTYVITDETGEILGLPMAQPFDLEGAGDGVCLLWSLAFDDEFEVPAVGDNALQLSGCFDLSDNFITITRLSGEECPTTDCTASGGAIAFADSTGAEITICADDGEDDLINVTVENAEGDSMRYIITDENFNIVGMPLAPPFNLEGAGAGSCLIWHIAYDATVTGLEMEGTIGGLGGCFSLSSFLTVNRLTGSDCADGLAPGTIAINEVTAEGFVELINLGNQSLDVSLLSLASTSGSAQLGDLVINCGGMIMKRGDLLVVDLSGYLAADGDELSLETPNGTMISYATWGTETNPTAAVEAGLWRTDATFGALNTDRSLQRVLNTATQEFAFAAPTTCAENDAVSGTTLTPAGASVTAYPNPFAGELIVDVRGLNAASTTLTVLDLTGRTLRSQVLNFRDGKLALPTANLAAGTYVIRLANEGGVSTLRVVKR
ncbi:hypothetical protein A3850_007595 [Lewinella sp. 4G2]|nr:hypothetical protein A3850_007595 [Lewinella sp. 4G2]